MPRTFKPQPYQGSKTVDRKPERPEYRHLYGRLWRTRANRFRESHPDCAMCGAPAYGSPERENGRRESLGAVDHIVPHRGDQRLFWDEANWQTLCTSCHNRKSAGEK